MTRKSYIFIFLTGIIPLLGKAQQLPQYSQYIFNSLIINPAYAGSKDAVNLNAISRYQWTGLEGAPRTQTFAIDGAASEKVGLGLHAIHDQTGIFQNTLISGSFAYRIPVGVKSRLSFGLSGGARFAGLRSSLINTDVPDPLLDNRAGNAISPNASAGLFFHNESFYAGFSAAELLAGTNNNNQSQDFKQTRHYFFATGVTKAISEILRVKTGILVKDDFVSPAAVDFNSYLMFFDRIWVGGSWRMTVNGIIRNKVNESYRKANALSLIVETYMTSYLRAGYSYDVSTSALRNFNTHEFSLGYTFPSKQESKMRTPRYF